MNNILDKSLSWSKALLIAFLAMGSFAACDDDDDVNLSALSTPGNENVEATVYTLKFTWDEVDNATQYAYELKNEAGEVVSGDVTNKTSVYFTGLNDGSTYTLDVWAYAKAYSDQYYKSKVASFTGTTVATKALAAPQNVTSTVDGTTVVVSWDAVEHADSYGYILDGGRASSTRSNSVTLKGLSTGSHEITIYGVSRSEEYPRADSTLYKFNVEKQKQIVWQCTGSFKNVVLNTTTDRTLIYYDDDTYTLKSWYGVEGYDLNFSVDASTGEMNIVSDYAPSGGWYWVATGVNANGTWLYPIDGCSKFTATSTGSYVYFWFNDNYVGYDEFKVETTVDDLVGTYDDHTYGDHDYAWSQGASFDWDTNTAGVTIARAAEGDDVNLTISGLAWYGEKWDATLEYDSTNSYLTGNIIINGGQVWSTWYTIGDESSATGDVIATFDHNGNITLKNYYMWYGGYWYIQMTTDLTKSK